jgi:drug/metabolite transporter (DMT)-like permease
LPNSQYLKSLGSVIIFTGLLSVAFLHAKLPGFKWFGMALVTLGLVIVGASDIMFDTNPKDDLNAIITGLFSSKILNNILIFRRFAYCDGPNRNNNQFNLFI